MATTTEAREVMARVYATRESIGAAIDQVLTAKALSPKDREQVIEDSLRGAPQAKAAWPRSTSLEDITRDVAAIDVPTVVIAGELDRVDSVDLLKAELLSRVPQAVPRLARHRPSLAAGGSAGAWRADRRVRRTGRRRTERDGRQNEAGTPLGEAEPTCNLKLNRSAAC
jgi:pimeloyl-ACP methyl ester carboxylesterase